MGLSRKDPTSSDIPGQPNLIPPPPQTVKPKIIPPSDICYFKRFNKSNILNFNKLSATSLGASAPRHVFAASCQATR